LGAAVGSSSKPRSEVEQTDLLAEIARLEVAVRSSRYPGIAVPQDALDGLDVRALHREETSCRVAQVVEPRLAGTPAALKSCASPTEDAQLSDDGRHRHRQGRPGERARYELQGGRRGPRPRRRRGRPAGRWHRTLAARRSGPCDSLAHPGARRMPTSPRSTRRRKSPLPARPSRCWPSGTSTSTTSPAPTSSRRSRARLRRLRDKRHIQPPHRRNDRRTGWRRSRDDLSRDRRRVPADQHGHRLPKAVRPDPREGHPLRLHGEPHNAVPRDLGGPAVLHLRSPL